MNKIISKKIFIKNKITTPKYFTITQNEVKKYIINKLLIKKKIKFPIVVKPVNEGSSIGVKIAKNLKELEKFSNSLFKNIIS